MGMWFYFLVGVSCLALFMIGVLCGIAIESSHVKQRLKVLEQTKEAGRPIEISDLRSLT